MTAGYIAIERDDCFQILEALGNAADLAASVDALSTQVEVEDAFALVRDQLLPDLPEL